MQQKTLLLQSQTLLKNRQERLKTLKNIRAAKATHIHSQVLTRQPPARAVRLTRKHLQRVPDRKQRSSPEP